MRHSELGTYTELHFNSRLREPVPADVLAALSHMVGTAELPAELPAHPLFATERWRWMLRTDSYYFDLETLSTLRYDEIGEGWYLCIRTNLKNYGGEIEKFIDWVMPYLDKYEGDFLGFYRSEQTDVPTLIYATAAAPNK
jgi:hypothetical protein